MSRQWFRESFQITPERKERLQNRFLEVGADIHHRAPSMPPGRYGRLSLLVSSLPFGSHCGLRVRLEDFVPE